MRPMPELMIEELPVDELAPYAKNAKIHTTEQVQQIANSISEFGFNDPVGVWDSPDGMEIVEGHGRVMAAKKLGLKAVPVVRLNHLSDEQRRAYALAHNQLTMNTGFDMEMLESELGTLDIDMAEFGFDSIDGESDSRESSHSVSITESNSILVECEDENQCAELYDELTQRGFSCRISTL